MDVCLLFLFQTALFDAPCNVIPYAYPWINLDSSRLSPKMITRGNTMTNGRVLKMTVVSILDRIMFLEVSVLCNSSVGINGNLPRYYAISSLAFLEFGVRFKVGRTDQSALSIFFLRRREH